MLFNKLNSDSKEKLYLKISNKDVGNLYLLYLGKKNTDYYFFISDGNKVIDTKSSLVNLGTTTPTKESTSLKLVKMDLSNTKQLVNSGNIQFSKSKMNLFDGSPDNVEFETDTSFIKELKILVNKESKEILDKVWYNKKEYYDRLEKFGLNDFKFKK